METKKEIRRALLKRRDELPQMQWDAFSNSIMDKVICHQPWRKIWKQKRKLEELY